jgi:S1-C subfamily serine protease
LLYRKLQKLSLSIVLIGVVATGATAQVATTPKPPQPPPDTLMIEAARRQTPQVVTVVHRLTGIKALALLQRNGERVATVDDELVSARNAVTSIAAGFALGDGQSIVARLPQAEIEALTMFQTAPSVWSLTPRATTPQPGVSASQAPVAQPAGQPPPPPRQAELIVVESSGKRFVAGYVGLDGGSGLSLLKISGLKVPLSRDASEAELAIGQSIRLFAPVRVARSANTAPGTISLRVGEIEGRITDITRTSTGKVAHLTVSAPQASAEIVGGIALNEAGETVGIVETSEGGKARLIPAAAVRRAAARVLARKSSVPRPWLGVRGEAVTAMPLEKFSSIGWTMLEAAKLKESYQGILLTSVAPGTPAAQADLRPGDVIVRVNNFEVKSPEDFSFFLNEAGSGATVNFTFFRGHTSTPPIGFTKMTPPVTFQTPPPTPAQAPQGFTPFQPFEVSVKMGEALNPAREWKLAEAYGMGVQALSQVPPIARGLETVTLSAKAAAHLGARGGVLVVFVDPDSSAARAGLRAFDVIESVDGRLMNQASWPAIIPAGDPQRLLLGIVRDRQKLEITIQQKELQKK